MDTIRLGYACVNTELRKTVFCSRSTVIATLVKLGPDAAVKFCKEKALQNIADLLTILKWNEQRGIRLFRITSTLFPHQGNRLLPKEFQRRRYFQGDIEFARPALEAVGAYAREMGHRLTAHVQPYLQLGTPNAAVLARTLFDLQVHEKIFKILATPDPVIIMHGGGYYQGEHVDRATAKTATLARWVQVWRKLPQPLRHWITLENDERIYGVADLLPFCERHGIQFCLDIFHNEISADHVAITPAILRRACATWRGRNRPKFHISNQDPALKFGAHAEMVKRIPDSLMRLRGVDIMVEAKLKEQAVLALYKKQFVCTPGARVAWRVKSSST